MTVVYLDVLFLINFSADYLILLLSGKLLHLAVSRRRLLAGGALGALLGTAISVSLSGILALFAALAALLLMDLAAFGWRGGRMLLRLLAVTLLVGALEGGIMSLLLRFVLRLLSKYAPEPDTGGKLALFLILSMLGYLSVRLASRLGRLGHGREMEARVTVGGRCKMLTLLVDSGCFLKEPLTSRAVVILSKKGAEGLLPAAVLFCGAGEMPHLGADERRRYYTIPYRTVGGRRLMHGYRPDSLELMVDGKTISLSVILGVGEEGESYGGRDGILPAGILDT